MRTGLAALAIILGTANADARTIILRSTGPSAAAYPTGRTLPEPLDITLRKGDTLTLLDGRGTTVLKGPTAVKGKVSAALSIQDYAFVSALTQARPRIVRLARVSFNLDEPSLPAAAAERPADGKAFGYGRKAAPASPARVAAAAAPKPRPGVASRPAAQSDLGAGIEFAPGSTQLTPASKPILDRLANALQRPELAGARFRIEGHVDGAQSRATATSLSTNRAKAVADYLVSRGVASDRLETIGHGFDRLLPGIAPTDARNRRIAIVRIDGSALPVASPSLPTPSAQPEPGLWDIDPSAGSDWCVEPSGDVALFRPVSRHALRLSIAGGEGPPVMVWPAGDTTLRLPGAFRGPQATLRIGWRDAASTLPEQNYQLMLHRIETEPDSIRALALAFDSAGCDVQLARLEAVFRAAAP